LTNERTAATTLGAVLFQVHQAALPLPTLAWQTPCNRDGLLRCFTVLGFFGCCRSPPSAAYSSAGKLVMAELPSSLIAILTHQRHTRRSRTERDAPPPPPDTVGGRAENMGGLGLGVPLPAP
jgi:hypothetical protein